MRVGIINRVPLVRAPFNQWTPQGADVTLISRYPVSVADSTNLKKVIVFADYDNDLKLTALVARLHQEQPFDRLITLSEFDILRVAKIRSLLHIPGQDYFSGTLYRDKITMKQFAQLKGLNVPRFARVTTLDEVQAFVAEFGTPAILKPSQQAGSKDVQVLNTLDEATTRNVTQALGTYGEMDLEQFIQGDLYHVDGIINQGQLQFVSVSQYLNDHGDSTTLNQKARTFADFTISEDSPAFKTLKTASQQLLRAPQLDYGTVHLEFILDATQRAFFVEMGSRTGGLMITNAIQHKYGLVMNEAAYKLQAGFNYQLSPQPPMTESGFLTVLPQNGRLVKFDVAPLRPEVQHIETNFEIGREYDEMDESTDYIAMVQFDALNGDAMQHKIEKINRIIKHNLVWG
ncbi:ATP-grasp domain-containing protein [Lactiplantibacillus pentosus]|uniref:ATP-grasp domain-containing protein n=2 Tax=Lactiplantibacillus pentosus TaxID=1589 RepID=A0AAX6LEC0_LACPE|nr:ATP-grasp domain-containing protein [Lactiplantibacillus pentosus]AYJ43039.1 ATP-grasp domain-containing protein [Lactiplantibacillus pentosus]KRK25312.1 hypothetical protein FD24_GL003160 [Lactiplantibacillus pentosus DSM 20314]MBU7495790.1 ATP-grasp domain-containing protein [Lactiplantibacillus pentosus]MCT3300789.1 ATP-grasp domain-containing protein [Lactiplantibacillus pentosus]MCT3312796.1 ATP-grasp domain-containing protein [Lactiplantibacillus pentosus]